MNYGLVLSVGMLERKFRKFSLNSTYIQEIFRLFPEETQFIVRNLKKNEKKKHLPQNKYQRYVKLKFKSVTL